MKLPNIKTVLSIGVKALLISGMISPFAFAFDYPEKGNAAAGAKAWSENCSRCHNMRSPSELRDDQWITTVFHMRVRAGLTGQESRDILTFLQGFNSSLPTNGLMTPVSVKGTASQSGKAIYGETCIACHGENGKGTLPGTPDFTQKNGRLSKSDSDLFNSILNGYQSKGSMMAMPAKGGDSSLSNAEVSEVLRYIRQTFGQ